MDKSPDAFRTISEVADDLGLPQHVLRFWETRFAQIKPMKRTYGEGYTIKGVQRLFKENGARAVVAAVRGDVALTPSQAAFAIEEESDGDEGADAVEPSADEPDFAGAEAAPL